MPGLFFFILGIAFLIGAAANDKPQDRKLFKWIGLAALAVGVLCVAFGIQPVQH